MINTKTLTMLRDVLEINNSIEVSYPVTRVGEDKTIQAFLKLDEELPTFYIYDMRGLLNAIKLVGGDEEADIEMKQNFIEIKDSNTTIEYNISPKSIINTFEFDDIVKLREQTMGATFDITEEQLSKVMSSGKISNASDFKIDIKNNIANISSSSNFGVKIEGSGAAKLKINTEVISKIPINNYKVEIYDNKIVFSSDDIDFLITI